MLAAGLLAGCASAAGPVVLDPPSPTAEPSAPTASPATPAPDTSATATPTTTPPPARPGKAAAPTIAGTVATGLRSPWGLAFLPDGGALVSERDTARVLRVSRAGGASVVGTVPDVAFGGEGGLLGLAVAPTFARDRWVYAYHTAPGENRVVRMRLSGGTLGPPQVLLDGIPAASIHNGGRLAFGPDGMLYVGTGDAADTARSPRPDTLAGKVLRLTPAGRVPADNPDPESPIWSSGHRNVQGLAWGEDGTMWASEFGANTWDELNTIRPGGDYGWPSVEGGGGREQGFVDPVVQWPTDQASPSGIAVTAGTVYVASLRGQRLWAVPVAGARAGEPVAFFTGELGRLRTVAVAPDGSLWLVTSNTDGRGVPGAEDDRILRLTVDER
jgi:glucose/arabinose dehydrogenase